MKKLLIILSIFLLGQPTTEQIRIASKYDNFIRPEIKIEVVDRLDNPDAYGANFHDRDYTYCRMQVINKSGILFEYSIIHETVHCIFKTSDEIFVNKVTNEIIYAVHQL
jgi:hypothetical protein